MAGRTKLISGDARAELLTLYTHTGQKVLYPRPKGKVKFNLSGGPGVSWAVWTHNLITGCLHGCPYLLRKRNRHQ